LLFKNIPLVQTNEAEKIRELADWMAMRIEITNQTHHRRHFCRALPITKNENTSGRTLE
jgi:hypothetical protein